MKHTALRRNNNSSSPNTPWLCQYMMFSTKKEIITQQCHPSVKQTDSAFLMCNSQKNNTIWWKKKFFITHLKLCSVEINLISLFHSSFVKKQIHPHALKYCTCQQISLSYCIQAGLCSNTYIFFVCLKRFVWMCASCVCMSERILVFHPMSSS